MLRERYIFVNYSYKTKRNEFSYLLYNIESLIQCEFISFVESHLLSYLDTKVWLEKSKMTKFFIRNLTK